MAEDDRSNGLSSRELLAEIRVDIRQLRDELRASRHDLANTIGAVSLRVDKLEYLQRDTDRRLDEADERAAKYVPQLEQLVTENSLASQMKKAGWTRRERMLAYGLFLFAFIGALGTSVSLIVLTRGG